LQVFYQIQGGNIKVSRVFIGECGCEDAMEDAVFQAADTGIDLTEHLLSAIIPVQNVCSPAERKESRI